MIINYSKYKYFKISISFQDKPDIDYYFQSVDFTDINNIVAYISNDVISEIEKTEDILNIEGVNLIIVVMVGIELVMYSLEDVSFNKRLSGDIDGWWYLLKAKNVNNHELF